MARQRRLNEAGSYHHITARGVNRCAVFLDDHDKRQFLSLLKESHLRFGCRVLAFCLMSNHIHLTVRDDRGSLSKTLHFLNGVYAKRFNHKHGRTGHLFERRFWSSMLDSDAYLIDCVAYVHRNPMEAGMVERPEDFEWSSYQSYVGARAAPTFLDTSIVSAHYGHDVSLLRAATERPPRDSLITRQLRSPNPPALLGVENPRDSPGGRPLARPSEHHQTTISIKDIIDACATTFNVSPDDISRRTQGRSNPARGGAALIAQRHAGHSLSEIAAALDLGSTAAVSMASRRTACSEDTRTLTSIDEALASLGLPGRIR